MNIQFVRFFWRKEIQKKTKILRKVTFPLRLDVLEFCTDELKSQISSYRDRIDSEFESGHIPVDGSTHANNFLESGIYELFGVVTHKGRAANSGHYIGWTKDSKSGDWFKFDDDVVTKVKEDDITALSGGGDWHTAYILFYRAAPWRKK